MLRAMTSAIVYYLRAYRNSELLMFNENGDTQMFKLVKVFLSILVLGMFSTSAFASSTCTKSFIKGVASITCSENGTGDYDVEYDWTVNTKAGACKEHGKGIRLYKNAKNKVIFSSSKCQGNKIISVGNLNTKCTAR
jgi:hypothetical protein